MPSPSQNMKLPAARAGQLKAFAAARGIGATEAREHLLNLAIEAGEHDDRHPGWEVIREGELVTLTLEGQRIPSMSHEVAQRVADNFQAAGMFTPEGKGQHTLYMRGGSLANGFNLDFKFAVGRHGAGVVVALEEFTRDPVPGESKRTTAAMTRGMAVDLARQIRKALTH